MLNKVILIGRLTKDPDLRYTQSGVAVARFSVAVSRPYANQQGERETDFIDVVAWRKLAETCGNYLRKGRLVAVEGSLQSRSYETQDGQKRRAWEVVAQDVRFLDRAGDEPHAPSGGEPEMDEGDPGFDDMADVPF